MLAGSHRNAWPDETGTGGRTNRNTHISTDMLLYLKPQTIFGSVSRVQQNRDCLPQQFTAWGFFIRL